jgi:hypothetical protein
MVARALDWVRDDIEPCAKHLPVVSFDTAHMQASQSYLIMAVVVVAFNCDFALLCFEGRIVLAALVFVHLRPLVAFAGRKLWAFR